MLKFIHVIGDMAMQDKKTYLYNELLNEMEECHRNKQYGQMSEIYAEMDRIIYGDDEYTQEDNELNRLESKTFFVPLLENNLIELPKEMVKELNISSTDLLSVTAVRYPDIIIINVYKKLLYDFSIDENVFGVKPLGKYDVKIENRRIKIKDYIVNAMHIKLYDTLQIDFLSGIMCIRAYQIALPYRSK